MWLCPLHRVAATASRRRNLEWLENLENHTWRDEPYFLLLPPLLLFLSEDAFEKHISFYIQPTNR
jgi:hypothetical protein